MYILSVPFYIAKGSGTHFEVQELFITSTLHMDINYTNEKSLGRKGLGTQFHAFPLKKALHIISLC